MNQVSAQIAAIEPPSFANENDYQERVFRYGFRLGSLGFLIPEGMQSTLIENATVYPIPNTVHWLKGLINVRGALIPVFDLGTMSEANITTAKKSVMVIKMGKRSMAVAIDSGQSIEQSTLSPFDSTIPEQLITFSKQIYQVQKTCWIEFDFMKCLNHFEHRIPA